jgi:type IV pilus assembly protein PilC
MNKIFSKSVNSLESLEGALSKNPFWRFTLKDQILFAKRMSILIKSGVPIVTSLHMIGRSSASADTKKMMNSVIKDVENGTFLSVSLAKFKKAFGELALNIIEIGEVSGTLHENLAYLSEELKKKQNLRRKVLSSMVYPIFIVVATVGISVMLTIFVFPKILPIFSSLNFKLPLSTRVLIFLSTFLIKDGFYFLLFLIAMGVLFLFSLKQVRPFRLFIHKIILKLPVFGSLAQGYNMANFARTLGVLMRSEISIVKALKITAKTMSNLAYKDNIETLAEHVTKGSKISVHLEKYPKLYPPMLVQMVSVGETTGNLSDTLAYIASVSEEEVEEATKNLSSVLEPILMVFMGLIVGFIAISIITPIYGITQNLHK